MPLSKGQVLQKRYRVVHLLGQGGMGAVYRAWDLRLDIPVALKEMVPQPGLDSKTLAHLREQFTQEAKVLARLEHPHLVNVTDYFKESPNAYLVMKFVKGESLAERIAREGALPEEPVRAWALQLLDALAHCHSQGILHRDIKPQNVVIQSTKDTFPRRGGTEGGVILVDFGLMKLWDPDAPTTKTVLRGMGTPQYAPPEQYETQMGHTDARSDLYSLGATLYHALAGQAPPTATMRIVNPQTLTPLASVRPNVSASMKTTVDRAMELQPTARFQSATEMRAALSGSASIPAGPSQAAPQATHTMPPEQQAVPLAMAGPAESGLGRGMLRSGADGGGRPGADRSTVVETGLGSHTVSDYYHARDRRKHERRCNRHPDAPAAVVHAPPIPNTDICSHRAERAYRLRRRSPGRLADLSR